MASLEEVLAFDSMLGVVELIKSGVPEDILPTGFTSIIRAGEGKQGTYDMITGTRETARQVAYGSPSVRRALAGVSKKAVTFIHTFEHIMHDPITLAMLRSVGNEARMARGKVEIDRQTAIFMRRFRNLRISAVCSALSLGTINFDEDGNLKHTASSAALSVDFGVPSGNKDQISSIIATKWDTTSAKIMKHLADLKYKARTLSGYPLKYAFYGSSIPDWLGVNDSVKAYVHANQPMSQVFADGGVPNLSGLTWVPVSEAFYVDAAGTTRQWFATDKVVFTPEPDPTWWEIIEGTYVVPTSLGNVAADAGAMVAATKEVRGAFSYAKINDDPVTIKHLAGDTFLPVLKVPSAIFIADVSF